MLNSDGARLAVSFVFLFLGFAAALTGAVLWIVDDTQTAALLRANDADIETIRNGFRDEGIDEALEVTRQRLGAAQHPPQTVPASFILIEDRIRGHVYGNLAAFAPRLGVFAIDADGSRVLGHGVELAPEIYLFVGRDTRDVRATRFSIARAFGWALAGSILLAGIGGTLLRRQLMRRVDVIARTCEGIIAGRFNERIPLEGRRDELERLAIAINEMLNRISALLENLRQMSSDVAHDLRTPLTRLKNRLEEARRSAVTTTDYAAAVARAIDDADQVLAMFAALLRISQIEAGTRVAGFSQLSLSGILDNVVELYRPVAEDHAHALCASIEPDVRIRGDAELLTQLFSNLIENAINHTPAATRILVALSVSEGAVVASVSDDGPGIPADEQEKVLRRFYRLSGSRSTAGHGLGLALAAAIATLHRASLRLTDAGPGLCVSTRF